MRHRAKFCANRSRSCGDMASNMGAQKINPAYATVQNVILLCLNLDKLYETTFVNQKYYMYLK